MSNLTQKDKKILNNLFNFSDSEDEQVEQRLVDVKNTVTSSSSKSAEGAASTTNIVNDDSNLQFLINDLCSKETIDFTVGLWLSKWEDLYDRIVLRGDDNPVKLNWNKMLPNNLHDFVINGIHLTNVENMEKGSKPVITVGDRPNYPQSNQFTPKQFDKIMKMRNEWTKLYKDFVKSGLGPYHFNHESFPVSNLIQLLSNALLFLDTINFQKLDLCTRTIRNILLD